MKKKIISFVVLMAMFSCRLIQAQNATVHLGAMAEKIPVAGVSTLELDVRVAVTEGSGYLLGLAMEQLYTGLFVPPGQHYRATDVKDIEIRYRWAIRKLPVFEYKNFKTMERNRYGDLAEVTRRRPVKQIGTRDDKYLVRDDNGDVVKIYHRPGGYDYSAPTGPAYYWSGVLGLNGMSLYALMQAGVPSETDPLSMTIKTLRAHLKEYGLPDRTWDVAWLTVAFSNLPKGDKELENLKLRLANKLLLGQVEAGDGKGLWGPICVNPSIVSAMMTYEQRRFSRSLSKIKADLKKDPEKKSTQRKLAKLDAEQNEFSDQYAYYTQIWTAANPQLIYVNLGDRDDVTNWIIVQGMPHFLYGESLADLESTRLVLFALNEARRNGCLPERTLMPKDSMTGRDLLPPLQSRVIIQNAVRAMSRLSARDGLWSEGNVCAAVKAFDSFGFVGLPVKAGDLPKLTSESTIDSTLNGYAASRLASILGSGTVPRNQLAGTTRLLTKRIPELLAESPKGNTDKARQPYRLALALANIPSPSPAVSTALVDYLLDARGKTKVPWGIKRAYADGVSSLKNHTDASLKRSYDAIRLRSPEWYPEFNDEAKTKVRQYRIRHYWRKMQDNVFRTAGAVIYLANAAQAPAVGEWTWTGTPQKDVALPRVLHSLTSGAKLKKPLAHMFVDADLSNLTPDIPILYISGSGTFSPDDKAMAKLTDYLAGSGFLVSFASASVPGLTFLDGVEKMVLKASPGATVEQFALAGGRVKLQAIVREDGTVAMVSFPVGNSAAVSGGSRPVMPGAIALSLMVEVFKTRLGPERLSEQPMVDLTRLSEIQQSILDAPVGDSKNK